MTPMLRLGRTLLTNTPLVSGRPTLGIPFRPKRVCLAALLMVTLVGCTRGASVTINGSQTYQVIDGFGVNANHRSWSTNELPAVLDALIDQAGMTLFSVIYDNNNWEAINDNGDPNDMNWAYYNGVYSAPGFQKFWGMMAYLNQRGITNGLVPFLQGPVALWMGGLALAPGYENEYAETIASLLVYARNTQHLRFSVVGPVNEPDNTYAGIHLSGAGQYVTVMRHLVQQLDANGLGDVRFSGPELASTSTAWLGAIMNEPLVMAKLDHFGLHSYLGASPDAAGVYDFIRQSAYPDRHFWMTEFNVWCQSCQTSVSGDNSWTYARGTATCLLNHLANGASAGLVWEGYDSQYTDFNPTTGGNDPPHWSYWGLLAVNDINAAVKTYTPRKGFYTVAQVARFVRPGARRIDVSGASTPLTVLAFYNTNNGQFTLTGVNTNASPATLSGTLTNLPALASLELYYTDNTTNLFAGGAVPVTNGSFSVSVPADCVFTLAATNSQVPEPTPTPTFSFGPPLTPVWDVSGTYQITNHAQGAKLRPMDIVFDNVLLSVDAKGKVQGAGTIVTYASDDYVGGDYKVSGKLSGGAAETQVKFTVKFKGSGIVADVSTTCKVNARYNLTVLPAARAMAGQVTGNVRFSSLGNGDLKSEIALPLPPGVDGGWNVYLDLYPYGTKLSGHGVVLVNNQPSQTLATKATGSLPRDSTTAKVKLSGYGYSRGTRINLQYVPVSETTKLLQTVNGKVLGQNVKSGS